jgi:hypothetical protein
MANFQPNPEDRNGRFDTGVRRLVMMLGETAKIDLFGPVPGLVVDTNARGIVKVSEKPIRTRGAIATYELTPIQPGNVMLEARLFDKEPATIEERTQRWFTTRDPWDYIQLSVMGNDYMQSGGTWGNTKYGSTNPAWKDVPWTTMAYAGCGPTALANVLDYLIRLFAASGTVSSVTPLQTMAYASKYGRAAGPDKSGDVVPQGTSGDVMLANVGKYWPGFAGEAVGGGPARQAGVDLAIRWLRMGTPLIFLASGNVTTWKYDVGGRKQEHKWTGGHFMVLIGVESNSQGPDQRLWVADPSLARTRYIDADNLSRCRIWRVYKTGK